MRSMYNVSAITRSIHVGMYTCSTFVPLCIEIISCKIIDYGSVVNKYSGLVHWPTCFALVLSLFIIVAQSMSII